MTHKVISIVLGGGRGKRLYPLTEKRSKPAVPIGGKYRLVDIAISNCLNSGYNRIFVLTQFNSASLNQHIKNTYNFSFFSNGFVDILAAEQTLEGDRWFEGTADAVRRIDKYLQGIDYDYVLILSGDQLYQMDYTPLIDFHINKRADITIATIPVTGREASGFGILKTNENHRITSFIEKPQKEDLGSWVSEVSREMHQQGRTFLASMGIYVFSKSSLISLLKENQGMDFGQEIIPYAINKLRVLSFECTGYWTDIGTIRSFFEANIGLTDDVPSFDLSKEKIFTRAHLFPPSKISGTILSNIILAEGCIINAEKMERSIIGLRSKIGKGTVIKRAYLMGIDSYERQKDVTKITDTQQPPPLGVGERCYIENAILDKNCRIGNDVFIQGGNHLSDADFESYSIRDGIVIVKRDGIIKNGVKIGLHSQPMEM
ncbi:glucose-1-phosphate adenylyltransferase [Olivibacter jilunii]|uniref:glucose-1-phosphate adenylyltransferase n=1 Tax=Olivibacter jilunii TaxID=985016 RepID=UPI00103115FA|nr:glucose-1-phosphate adenylyltransferase [Olivibacter jilunii]